MAFDIKHGDCLEAMRGMADNSVDSIVTDPPYCLSFMGKKWDYDVPEQAVWEECLRVLKPGGHLLAFAGTRTQHRMAVRIEDAGFEIRDMIAWVYGSGFPKSLDVSKAIDKAAGVEREVIGMREHPTLTREDKSRNGTAQNGSNSAKEEWPITSPATEAASQWQGWGTALKPALEPITVARKPFSGTVAANVLEHGTGAINVDGCRVGTDGATKRGGQAEYPKNEDGTEDRSGSWARVGHSIEPLNLGRWPANLIHDGSEDVLAGFPQSKGTASGGSPDRNSKSSEAYWGEGGGGFKGGRSTVAHGDNGSAARFFYCAKASKADRGESNGHPTVKPTELMRYLVRLVTQPGGTVLDPFTGSGSTGKAAILEGFSFIGIEKEEASVDISTRRMKEAQIEMGLFA